MIYHIPPLFLIVNWFTSLQTEPAYLHLRYEVTKAGQRDPGLHGRRRHYWRQFKTATLHEHKALNTVSIVKAVFWYSLSPYDRTEHLHNIYMCSGSTDGWHTWPIMCVCTICWPIGCRLVGGISSVCILGRQRFLKTIQVASRRQQRALR